jgi:hypothetical protein
VRSLTACGLVLTIAAAILLAGCGGGKSSNGASAKAQIKSNWEEFFNGSTSTDRRVALLENGSRFASLLKTIDSFSLAKQVKATVSKVVLNGSDSATVTYSVTLSGQPVLHDTKGTAVRIGNVWKVGTASFCGLVKLEGASPKACSAAQ